MSGLLRLLHAKRNPPALPTANFKNKSVLITGSNTGLGFAAAQHFLRLQATHVILAVRSLQKGEAAKSQLEQEFGKRGAVSVMHLDMNSFESVRDFAEELDRTHTRLDIAILNAGLVNQAHHLSPSGSGWEETLQVNTLSTTLLALLLIPTLRHSAQANPEASPGYLILVSSGSHNFIKRDALPEPPQRIFEQLSTPSVEGGKAATGQTQYAISKLLLMYNLPYLANVGGDEVIVTSCCPGATKTDLGRYFATSWWMRLFIWLYTTLMCRTSEEGARTLVSAAYLGKEAKGGYWKNDTLMERNPLLKGEEGRKMGEAVWRETLEIVGEEKVDVKL